MAFRSSDGTIYFQHQDWAGTERVGTNYAGSSAALCASFAYCDQSYAFDILNASSACNQDNLFFAGLDFDASTSTDHATFREYTDGRKIGGRERHYERKCLLESANL